MKMNNKGFAATGILYTILVLFILLIAGLLTLLYSRNTLLHQIQKEVKDDVTNVLLYTMYETGTDVYFNPVTGKICSDYTANNSNTAVISGCMKWYVFNDSNTNSTVNMMLDHNTTLETNWNQLDTQLASNTSKWITGINTRIINAYEIAQILGVTIENIQADGSIKMAGTYSWLWGTSYWTSTESNSDNTYAWHVNKTAQLSQSLKTLASGFGVRPVITISKTLLS